jgi:glycosyltransferase involved in cell wall biosynthesis
MKKQLAILGTRGIPAQHGGFETFAERLALYLVQRQWEVTVYCQGPAADDRTRTNDMWQGVRRITLPAKRDSASGSMAFDFACVRDVATHRPTLVLTLGYNHALFCAWLRLSGVRNLINMDELERRQEKWRWYERIWLRLNERVGTRVADHLIAGHPLVADHLAARVTRRKITAIPYGADRITGADESVLLDFGVIRQKYALVVTRPEPENSLLEIVQAFSMRPRNAKLVVLGSFRSNDPYHRMVLSAASGEVSFPGAIYDHETLRSLRFHARFYLHGHRTGGANQSLVDALGAGNAAIAHDNPFNRWVAQEGAHFFSSVEECDEHISTLLESEASLAALQTLGLERFDSTFQWDHILGEYESLLTTNAAGTLLHTPLRV